MDLLSVVIENSSKTTEIFQYRVHHSLLVRKAHPASFFDLGPNFTALRRAPGLRLLTFWSYGNLTDRDTVQLR